MPIDLRELRKELYPGLNPGSSWQELAKAALDIGAACGVDVKISLNLTRDVLCAKVAGYTTEITRRELEDREFGKLYAMISQAAAGTGVKMTADELAILRQRERLRLAQMQAQMQAKRSIYDNPYKQDMAYLGLARAKSESAPVYMDAADYERLRQRGLSEQAVREVSDFMNEGEVREFDPQSSFIVTTPPIDLHSSAEVAAPETPDAPDLILD